MSKDKCLNDNNKDLCRYITFWYCQTRHIILSLLQITYNDGKKDNGITIRIPCLPAYNGRISSW